MATYFFDNNLSPKFVAALCELGVDARHIRTTDGFHRKMPDDEWLALVVEKGWFSVTVDTKMRKSAGFYRCVKENKAGVFMLRIGNLQFWDQAAHIVTSWPDIEEAANDRRKLPFVLENSPRSKKLSPSGRLK